MWLRCSSQSAVYRFNIPSSKKDARAKTEQAQHDFASVLEGLQHVQIEPGLVGEASVDGDTLYDFVDDESVHALRTQASAAVHEMEVMRATVLHMLDCAGSKAFLACTQMVRRRCAGLLQTIEERVHELVWYA